MNLAPITFFSPQGEPLPLDEITQRIINIPSETTLIISSPEPTTHPNFSQIAASLSRSPAAHTFLFTNCRNLATTGQCQTLQHIPNLNIIATPFDTTIFLSGEVPLFNSTYQQNLQAIAFLLSNNLRIGACIPILPTNAPHLNPIITGLTQLGLTNIFLNLHPLSSLPPQEIQSEYPSYSNMHHYIQNAINSVDFIIPILNVPPCMLGTEFDHASQLLGPADPPKTKVAACASCAFNPSCPGMFLDYIQHFGSSEIGAIREDGTPLWNPVPESLHPTIFAVNDIHEKLSKGTINHAILPSPDELLHLLKGFSTPQSFWDIAHSTGYPAPILHLILTAMEEKGIISISQSKISLTVSLPPQPLPCADFSSKRVSSDPSLCQLRVSHNDLAKRTHYIIETVPTGGVLAVLGDDDFFSLTMASTKHFSHIVVFEIDPRIADAIETIAKNKQLPVTVVLHDLRMPIPARFWNRFDAFYTDCPYTPAGFELFVSRGVLLLKKTSKKHGFASFSPEFPIMEDVELAVQEVCTSMGLFIEGKGHTAGNSIPEHISMALATPADIHHALTHPASLNPTDTWYLGTLGRKESLFHFLTTQLTKPTIMGPFTGEIYHHTSPLQWYQDNLPKKIA